MNEVIQVVVVDDVAETRSNIARLLEFDEGIVVVGEAGDGYEALDVCRKLLPDCVLLDVNMPILDGIATAEILLSQLPDTVVVMMSVQDDHQYLERAAAVGAQGYLVKPFSVDELAKAVRAAHKTKIHV